MKGRVFSYASWLGIGLLVALVSLAFTATPASAKDMRISLGPGETARIPMRFWCLEFGKPFPQAITGPAQRAPDAVVKVLQAAVNRGQLNGNPYQTQLAVWKAADGQIHDTANEGHATADQLLSDSANINLSSVPAGTMTLDQAAAQGKVKVTVENFAPINDTAHPNVKAYAGVGDLVIQNTSNQAVNFLFVDGSVFNPASGNTDQMLAGQQDATKQATLPTTGGNEPVDVRTQALLWMILASVLVAAGTALGGLHFASSLFRKN